MGDDEGSPSILKTNPWLGLAIDAVLAIVLAFVAFAFVALPTNSFTLALFLGPVLGILGAYAIGYKWLGYGQGIQERVNGLPMWARLLLPLPVGLLLTAIFLVPLIALGFVIDINPVLVALLALVLGFGAAIALFWFGGTIRDVPGSVKNLQRRNRLIGLVVAGLLVAALLDALVLVLTGNVYLATALAVPLFVVAVVGLGFVTGWRHDATEEVLSWNVLVRLGVTLLLLVLLTPYAALLIGPVIPNVVLTYILGTLLAGIIVVPFGLWTRAFRDAWGGFKDLGGEHRVLVVLPTLPIGAVVAFLLVAFLVGSFELATIVSVPAGVAVFLLFAAVFGLLAEIPPAVRGLNLPLRILVFVLFALLVGTYVAFSVALYGVPIDLAALIGLAVGGLVLAALVKVLNLGTGLGEEFESYGALAEGAVVLLIFLVATALAFLALALTTGSFPIALGVGVLLGLIVTLVVAQVTGLIEGARTVLDELPWWGELLVLGTIFLAASAYGALVIGPFIAEPSIGIALGVVVGLLALFVAVKFFRIGGDLLEREVHERAAARATLLVLAFLAGFLVGLFASAAALGAVDIDLFGLPFFIAIAAGIAALLATAAWGGWLGRVLGLVSSVGDAIKVTVIVATWLLLGAVTGLVVTSVVEVELLIALAGGIIVWTWLPIVLLRLFHVRSTPVTATRGMDEKPRALAGLAWGLLAAAIVLILGLAVLESPVLPFVFAVAVGYVVALIFALRPRHEGSSES